MTSAPSRVVTRYQRSAGNMSGNTSILECRSLSELLRRTCEAHAEKTAVVWGARQISYAELLQRANAVASGLRAAGLRHGDRCAIWLPNTGEFVELYFGMALAGVIAVPVNFRFTASEVSHVLSDSEPSAVILHEQYRSTWEDTKLTSDRCRVSLCVEIGHGPTADYAIGYEPWLLGAGVAADTVQTDEDLPFFIGYTSGTTGLPKGAVVRQRPMIENVAVILRDYAPLGSEDRFLTLMPLFHSNSTWFVVTCVAIGATNVIMDSGSLSGEKILDVIDKQGITATSLVPTILQMVLDARRPGTDESGQSLRLLLCGSAPITAAVKQRVLRELSVDLVEGYGATETGVVTSLPPAAQLGKLTSVGWPVTGKQVQLRDSVGREVPVGEVGELWCRGTAMLLDHYWRNESATRNARDADGWYTVGDMARVDSDGAVFLVDRKNDMIISGGENIYPTEVETALLRHASVHDAAVVGLPDERWGERVHAVVTLVKGAAATTADILDCASEYLARYKLPRSLEIWADLPKTATGKIQRRKVRETVVSTSIDSRDDLLTGEPV